MIQEKNAFIDKNFDFDIVKSLLRNYKISLNIIMWSTTKSEN